MAVTKIWNIRGKAGSPLEYIVNPEKTQREFTESERQALADVIAYAANEDKTEKLFYTTGIYPAADCIIVSTRTDKFNSTCRNFICKSKCNSGLAVTFANEGIQKTCIYFSKSDQARL